MSLFCRWRLFRTIFHTQRPLPAISGGDLSNIWADIYRVLWLSCLIKLRALHARYRHRVLIRSVAQLGLFWLKDYFVGGTYICICACRWKVKSGFPLRVSCAGNYEVSDARFVTFPWNQGSHASWKAPAIFPSYFEATESYVKSFRASRVLGLPNLILENTNGL